MKNIIKNFLNAFNTFLYIIGCGILLYTVIALLQDKEMMKTLTDAPEFFQFGMQEPATPMMEGMLYFHNYLMVYIIFIGVFVFYMLFYIMYTYNIKNKTVTKAIIYNHDSLLEIIWTILPAIILLIIAVPSFSLLYSLDELVNPELTLKIIGHQWYWSYEMSDYALTHPKLIGNIRYDSYMISTDALLESPQSSFRLFVSLPVVFLPHETHIRLLVTSADVIHSWAVPSFGIKVDACPGRLSQASLYINKALSENQTHIMVFGQCSEICGVNHGFMPITIRVIQLKDFLRKISLET